MTFSKNIFGTGLALAALTVSATAHIAFWDPSMWGFNVTAQTFPYDNRPVVPLMDMTFKQWWFHGHMDYPPHPGNFFDLPAGGTAKSQLACDKGATDWYPSSQGGDIRQGDWPCPGQTSSQFHTTGEDDTAGCALAITYKSNEWDVQPEDFAVFSTNRKCVWNRHTDFQVPAAMPACPPEGCICAWFWIHASDSGGQQNYMNSFRCKVSGATGTAPIAKAQLPRRCGADPDNGKFAATPSNCTNTAKQPFYWYNKERNNMKEGTYAPPQYNELYGYNGGAENNIFVGGGANTQTGSSGNSGSGNSGNGNGGSNSQNQPTTTVKQAEPTKPAEPSKAPENTPVTSVTVVQTKSTSTTIANVAATSATFTSLASKTVGTSTPTSSGLAASASTTRRCRARKTKRAEFEKQQRKERAIPPHAGRHGRHHNVGRFVDDSTLH